MYLASKVESTHLSCVNVTLNIYINTLTRQTRQAVLRLCYFPLRIHAPPMTTLQYETLAASLAWMNLDGLDELGWRWRLPGGRLEEVEDRD